MQASEFFGNLSATLPNTRFKQDTRRGTVQGYRTNYRFTKKLTTRSILNKKSKNSVNSELNEALAPDLYISLATYFIVNRGNEV